MAIIKYKFQDKNNITLQNVFHDRKCSKNAKLLIIKKRLESLLKKSRDLTFLFKFDEVLFFFKKDANNRLWIRVNAPLLKPSLSKYWADTISYDNTSNAYDIICNWFLDSDSAIELFCTFLKINNNQLRWKYKLKEVPFSELFSFIEDCFKSYYENTKFDYYDRDILDSQNYSAISLTASEVNKNQLSEYDLKYFKIDDTDGLSKAINSLLLTLNQIEVKLPPKPKIFDNDLLNIDYFRLNLDPYPESMFISPSQGSWDINLEKDINNDKNYFYRDPHLDIKEGEVVGIDFGTKSTVVVCQNENFKSQPMRIGGLSLNKSVCNSDFENPTILEFKNITSFLDAYAKVKGRPLTKISDLPISYRAATDLLSVNDVKSFSTFLYDIKQWAANCNKKIKLYDSASKEIELNPYLTQKAEEIDPVELYAYYIGSYINNMYTGIHLDYIISFPVTYDKDLKDKLLNSFTKGIKKSLPEAIINDESVMKKFSISFGASEPAAYAICALQEYGINPKEDEEFNYGIFDFGGGTTDFDFGTWKLYPDPDSYDYELIHFGSGGQKFLGGENLLRELAYDIFVQNKDTIIQNSFTFTKPSWCDSFIGCETLINDSLASQLNTKFLIEKIRPYWEESEEKINFDSPIKINLFDNTNNLVTGFELTVDENRLKTILEKRINSGVESFFIALQKSFKDVDQKEFNVFLAGNSSKHSIVTEAFNKQIEFNKLKVKIYPGLGTPQALELMKSNNVNIDNINLVEAPTAKTGVAFGLVNYGGNGRIHIVNKNENVLENETQLRFRFFVGKEIRRTFSAVLTPDSQYGERVKLLNLTSNKFNISFTSDFKAFTDNFAITETKHKIVKLNKAYDSSYGVYIKIIKTNIVAYDISKNDGSEKEIESGEIVLE